MVVSPIDLQNSASVSRFQQDKKGAQQRHSGQTLLPNSPLRTLPVPGRQAAYAPFYVKRNVMSFNLFRLAVVKDVAPLLCRY